MSKIINKIKNDHPEKYIIIHRPGCGYCLEALKVLKEKEIPHKKYNIDNQTFGKERLFEILREHHNEISFDMNHNTFPIIFYNGKFIGGYNELLKLLSKQSS